MADNPALMNSLYARQPATPRQNSKDITGPIGSSISNPTGGINPSAPLPGAMLPKPDMSKVGGVVGPARPPMQMPTTPLPIAGTGTQLPPQKIGGVPPTGAPMPGMPTRPIPPMTNPANLGPVMPSFGFGGPKEAPTGANRTQPMTGRAVAGGVPPSGQQNNGAWLASLVGGRSAKVS